MKLFEKEVAGQIQGKESSDIFVKLFFNNLQACILLFLGGASFGILTIFIMSLNGIVIGAIMEIVHKDHSAVFVAAAILPHGIFEIPAFILSGALGILLAQSLIAEWYNGEDTAEDAQKFGRYVLILCNSAPRNRRICRGFYYAGYHTFSSLEDLIHGRRYRHPATKTGLFWMV